MSKNEKSKKEFMEQLYHQYYQSLMRQALYYIRFDRQFFHIAHDSVMDTFDAALASYNIFASHPNQHGWLRLALKRRLSAHMKQTRAEQKITVELDEISFPYTSITETINDIEQLVENQDNQVLVERLMKPLGEKERTLIRLYYFEHQSAAEIATLYKTSERVVNTQLYRIRKKMNKISENGVLLLILMLRFHL